MLFFPVKVCGMINCYQVIFWEQFLQMFSQFISSVNQFRMPVTRHSLTYKQIHYFHRIIKNTKIQGESNRNRTILAPFIETKTAAPNQYLCHYITHIGLNLSVHNFNRGCN